MQRFSPRSEGSEPHIGLHSPGVLHWKDEYPQYLALKASGAFFQETLWAVGNRDSTLKRYTQNRIHCGTQGRSSNLKGPWVRTTHGSWQVSWGGRRQLDLTLGTQTLMVTILGSLFYHMDTGAGEHHFVNLPLASSSASGPSTAHTHQPVGTGTGMPQAKRLAGQGHSPTYQWAGCLKTP